jgi:hypothetical protein
MLYEVWLFKKREWLQESTLLMTILYPHVLPFGVISTGSFTPLHTNLPGLETALSHLASVLSNCAVL